MGHSGAGPLLPQVRARARREPSALVFVDAGVPPETDDAELMPGELLSELRAMACDGVLPRWSQWFGPGAMERLVPDAERRAEVSCELPQLAVSYFEGRVPAPTGWAAARCGYVQLSGPYAADAAEAATRGWPVFELRSTPRHRDAPGPGHRGDPLRHIGRLRQAPRSRFPGTSHHHTHLEEADARCTLPGLLDGEHHASWQRASLCSSSSASP